MSHASLGSFQQWRGFRSWAVRICLPQAGPDREIGKYKKERHNSWGEGENAAYPIGDVFRPDVSQLAVTSGLLPQSQRVAPRLLGHAQAWGRLDRMWVGWKPPIQAPRGLGLCAGNLGLTAPRCLLSGRGALAAWSGGRVFRML